VESTPVRRRTIVIGAVQTIVVLPLVLVLIGAMSSYARHPVTHAILTSAGETREYVLHLPADYDRARPAPLVISMHGAANSPALQMHISQWNRAADANGFIVVYPAGTGTGPKTFVNDGWRTPSRMPDVVFISELIDRLEGSYNIDPARIYANGLSNGGGMAFVLSCTLSERIAAVGAVSSAETLPWSWCPDSNPVPMIAFHGTADRYTPYHGAKVWFAPDRFPDIPTWTANWARRNRCGPQPMETVVAVDVTRREYTGCADNAPVVLYTIAGGGHTWPGGTLLPEWLLGRTTASIDATDLMWAFFQQHPLTARRSR
jgi:polyhydroxybutyrate depolymerase